MTCLRTDWLLLYFMLSKSTVHIVFSVKVLRSEDHSEADVEELGSIVVKYVLQN